MSNAEHYSKQSRRMCTCCGGHKARFRYHGVVRADRHHTLCFRCYRSALDQLRSRVLFYGRYGI